MIRSSDDENIESDAGHRMVERSQRVTNYTDSRRRPLANHRFKVGDLVLTKKGHTGKLTERVVPHTFHLDNRFCINTRNTRHCVNSDSGSEKLPSILHFSLPNYQQTYPQPSPRSSAQTSKITS